jgi:hypothetical protein
VMHSDPLRHILKRDSVETVFRKKVLGRIEYLLDRFRALLRLL